MKKKEEKNESYCLQVKALGKRKINQVEFDLKENHHRKACKSLHSRGSY